MLTLTYKFGLGGRTIERKSVIFYKLPPMKIPCPDTLIHLLVTHIAHPTLFCGLHVQSRFARTGMKWFQYFTAITKMQIPCLYKYFQYICINSQLTIRV